MHTAVIVSDNGTLYFLTQEGSRARGLEGGPELLLRCAWQTVRQRELDLGVL